MKLRSVLCPSDIKVLNCILIARANRLPLPTLREMASGLFNGSRSTNWVHMVIKKLIRLGLIEMEPAKARTIAPTVRFIPVQRLEIERVTQQQADLRADVQGSVREVCGE